MLIELCKEIAQVPHEKAHYTGIRKIVQGVTHEVTTLPTVDLATLGYRGGKTNQLLRNYFNQAEIDAAKTKLGARRGSDHTSVAINTIGQAKSEKSQGFCLRSLVITQTKKWTEVDIVYRSTEIIQKNGADFDLFPRIIEQLNLAHTPRVYRFYFANVFLTALFAPLLFQRTDPIEFYELLKKHDPKYYRTFLNATAKFFETDCRYHYKHREKMWTIAGKTLDIKKLSQYCHDNGASFIVDESHLEDTE